MAIKKRTKQGMKTKTGIKTKTPRKTRICKCGRRTVFKQGNCLVCRMKNR